VLKKSPPSRFFLVVKRPWTVFILVVFIFSVLYPVLQIEAKGGDSNTPYVFHDAVPPQPFITSPLAASYSFPLTNGTLTSSAYSTDPEYLTHLSSDWKVQTGSNCSVDSGVSFSSLDDTGNKTSITVSATLSVNTSYYACVRHTNSVGDSTWSAATLFKTITTASVSTQNYDFSTSSEYTVGSNASVSGGVASTSTVPWYNSSWTRRKPVTVTEQTGSTLTNYEVRVSVTYDADMQADFDDIRFTDADGITVLDHWLDVKTDSTSAVFWVEVPTLSASAARVIFMYYGNSGATSSSNGSTTFDYFDDFSGTLSAWNTGGASGTWAIVSGKLHTSHESIGVAYLLRNTSTPPASSWTVDVRGNSDGGGAYTNFGAMTHRNSSNNNLIFAGGRFGGQQWVIEDWDAGTDNASGLASANDGTIGTGVWYDLTAKVNSSNQITIFADQTQKLQYSYVGSYADVLGLATFNGINDFDDYRVRSYAATEPTVSVGVEVTSFANTTLSVSNNTGVTYSSLHNFTQTLGGSTNGSVNYQISNDNSSWYYFNTGTYTWVSATTGNLSQMNTSTQVDGYLNQFSTDVGLGSLYVASYLLSTGGTIELSNLAITYNNNTAPIITFGTATQSVSADGRVTVTATVSDSNSDTTKVKFEYSDDGGTTWKDPDLISVNDGVSVDLDDFNTYQMGTSNPIDTNVGSVVLTIVWDTRAPGNDGGASNLVASIQDDIKVRLTANDGTSDGTPSTSSAFTVDNLEPSGMSSFRKTASTSTTMSLAWTAVSAETNFDHYEIWYGTNSSDVSNRTGTATEWDNTDDSTLATMATTSTIVTGLSAGTTYYLKIWAVDDYGNVGLLDVLPAFTNALSTVTTVTPILAITGTGFVTISYIVNDANQNNVQSLVEYNVGSGWAKATLSTVSGDTTVSSGTAPSITNANTYPVGNVATASANTVTVVWLSQTDVPAADLSTAQVRVTPTDTVDVGSVTASSDFILDNVDPVGLANLSLASESNSIRATWTAVTSENHFDHYELWYGTNQSDVQNRTGSATEYDGDNSSSLLTSSTASVLLFTLTTTSGTTYYVKIWAVDDYGNEVTISDQNLTVAASTTTTTTSYGGGGGGGGSGGASSSSTTDSNSTTESSSTSTTPTEADPGEETIPELTDNTTSTSGESETDESGGASVSGEEETGSSSSSDLASGENTSTSSSSGTSSAGSVGGSTSSSSSSGSTGSEGGSNSTLTSGENSTTTDSAGGSITSDSTSSTSIGSSSVDLVGDAGNNEELSTENAALKAEIDSPISSLLNVDVSLFSLETRSDLFASTFYLASIKDRDGNFVPDWYEKINSTEEIPFEVNNDSDQDGISDGKEYLLGTDLDSSDSDSDGIDDEDEILEGTNPLLRDSDSDGLSDIEEAILGVSPVLEDSDGDGFTDAFEVRSGSDPLVPGDVPLDENQDGAPDQWVEKYDLPTQNYGTTRIVENRKKNGTSAKPIFVRITFAMTDTDGDGLTDRDELIHGSDPTLKDSDGDGVTDGEEVHDYHTNPIQKTLPENLYKTRISSLVRKNLKIKTLTFTESRPVIKGVSQPDSTIIVLAIPVESTREQGFFGSLFADLFGVNDDVVTERSITDESGKFLVRPTLDDGKYMVVVRSLDRFGNISDETLPTEIEVNTDLAREILEPRQLDQEEIDLDHLSLLQIKNEQPYLYGKADSGYEVVTTWKSTQYTSSLLVDTEEGEFIVNSPSALENGDHDLLVYAVNTQDNVFTPAVDIDFAVVSDGSESVSESTDSFGESSSRSFVFWLLMGAAGVSVVGGVIWGIRRRGRSTIISTSSKEPSESDVPPVSPPPQQ